MKRVNNIYHKVYDIKNIMAMAHKVVINTKNKHKVDRFETYYPEEIISIKNTLEKKQYKPGKYNIFLIWEPKVRLIMSSSIRDKIINHLVSYFLLVDYFDGSFIDSCIATRENKGTHYGLKLVKKNLNIAKKFGEVYYLKFDIRKYFYNIDHEITKELVRKKIKDKDALDIIDTIIDSTDATYVNEEINKVKDRAIKNIINSTLKESDKEKKIKEIMSIPYYKEGKGFSIGNMSSQIFGILYLSELDHFIKEKLHIKYYVRYMDDGILIHNDKKYLEYCLSEIENVLRKYKLELNYNKSFVRRAKYGLDFLGFVFFIKNNKVYMKVRNKTKLKYNRKMKNVRALLKLDLLSDKEYFQIFSNYKGHLKWGNCNGLIESKKN